MFKTSQLSFVVASLLLASCGSPNRSVVKSEGQAAEAAAFDYAHTLTLNDYKGQTHLAFMQDAVRPAMVELATNGYEVCAPDEVQAAFDASNKKVQGKVTRNFGGIANVKKIVKALQGTTVTLATLPQEIRKVDAKASIYDMANFIGLACGGGVRINYDENNYGLNVHYDVTEERSGRSFGVGPTRGANDASDKEYLTDLQAYVTGNQENLGEFYKTLFQSLLNSDSANITKIEDEGQTVITDFLSVFTAEQARNLMDDEVSPHWDAALLEVTLLAAFHAGQEEIKLYYNDPQTQKTSFTSQTRKQTPCEVPEKLQTATLADYWQFSRNITDPKNCKRSGINITKREFRQLGEDLTAYMTENHPEVVTKLRTATGMRATETNVLKGLSYVIVSDKTPRSFTAAKVRSIASAWTAFLGTVTEESVAITEWIENK
jgi:hypothetical protein